MTSLAVAACGLGLVAQTPLTPAPQQIHADMNRLMRGVLFPAANVVFSAQADDPGQERLVLTQDPAMATDPLVSAFGGWQAVENAALALAESANLLTMEGRPCSNGVVAPTKDPVWAAFVQQMRDASMKSYRAAQKKSQDEMTKLAVELNASCAGCHRRWRDRRGGPDNRCK